MPCFTWPESNANDEEQRIFRICIRFGSVKSTTSELGLNLSNEQECSEGRHQALPEEIRNRKKKKSILYSDHVHVGLTFQIFLHFYIPELMKYLPFYIRKLVNANPGLKVNRSIDWSCISIQMFFTSYILWVYSLSQNRMLYIINRKSHCKVTKLKPIFSLILG